MFLCGTCAVVASRCNIQQCLCWLIYEVNQELLCIRPGSRIVVVKCSVVGIEEAFSCRMFSVEHDCREIISYIQIISSQLFLPSEFGVL